MSAINSTAPHALKKYSPHVLPKQNTLNSNSSLEHNLNFLINVQSSESQTQWKGQSCRYSSQNQNLHQT